MSLQRYLVVGLALSLLAAAPLAAQEGQQGGGRRRGFGFGGFGQGGGFQFNSVTLLGLEQVQKELELVDEQKAELTKLGEEMRAQFTQGGGFNFQEFQSLSEEERQARMEELRKQIEERTKEAEAKVAEILLPPQIDRLKQIRIQTRGTRAFEDEEVASVLGISDEQKQQIAAIREESQAKVQELFAAGGQDQTDEERAANREKFEQLRKESDERITAVLSADQLARFEEMKGEKFELDMSQFRGQGGGRRRGGNRPEPEAQQ
jgi:hypothetical protein